MTPHTRNHAWETRRIYISGAGTTHFHKGTIAEECTSYSADSAFRARRIGAFSYFGKRCEIANTDKIGRYCSFGQDILVGAGPHPTDWLSSSNMFFRANRVADHPSVSAFFDGREIPPFRHGKAMCTIGHDIWCGSKAMVMMGVTVGHGAVIAGGAVVTKDVPPYAIVGGNPARIIRMRFDEHIVDRMLASAWWDIKPNLLKDVDVTDPVRALDQIGEIKAAHNDWAYEPAVMALA